MTYGLRPFNVGKSTDLETWETELDAMTGILMGRERPPIDEGVGTLQEVAGIYHARAKEIEMSLHRGERDGLISKGSPEYKFRTGELRSFIDLSKGAFELGSRRVTIWKSEREGLDA